MAEELEERVKRITTPYAEFIAALISKQRLIDDDPKIVLEVIDVDVVKKNIDFINVASSIMKYERFNPKVMIEKLMTIHNNFKREIATHSELIETVKFYVTVNGEVKPVNFTNNMSFVKDMRFICEMFVTKGATFDNIMKRSINPIKKCMNMMQVKYGINILKRRRGQMLNAKIVTISRIAACFPTTIVGLFHKEYGRMIFDKTTLFPDNELPKAMYSPMVASVIPKIDESPLSILMAIAVKTDDILHQTSFKTSLSAIYQYLLALYNSTAVTELGKIKSCILWGIIEEHNGDYKFVSSIVNTIPVAKEAIRRMRPNDPSLNFIIAQL